MLQTVTDQLAVSLSRICCHVTPSLNDLSAIAYHFPSGNNTDSTLWMSMAKLMFSSFQLVWGKDGKNTASKSQGWSMLSPELWLDTRLG